MLDALCKEAVQRSRVFPVVSCSTFCVHGCMMQATCVCLTIPGLRAGVALGQCLFPLSPSDRRVGSFCKRVDGFPTFPCLLRAEF